MYSRLVTKAAVDEASAKQGWPLVRHTQDQIDHAVAHFADLWDADSKRLVRTLTDEEQQFIKNERKLCALDFRGYWLEHYTYIINFERQVERFQPNVAQQIVMDLWADREEQGLAIWMQQLKARRLGVSTISELAVNHRFQFWPNSNCVVASADPTKTLEMGGMIKFNLDQQPWWLLPQSQPKIAQGMPVHYEDINSSLTLQAGNQFTGVARGSTPDVVHLSELMEFRDAESLIDGALMRAVIDHPGVFGILESTGGGIGTWWHRTWEQNKRDFARGRARVIPVFLPWYVGTDLYPSEADLRARPVPGDWVPSDKSIAHAERARAYVLSNSLLFKHLAKGNRDWKLSREQMWFREIEYETAKEKKQLHIFHMELCADDFEAFQSSNVPVIDPEILLNYQARTRNPIGAYTVIGPDIPQELVTPRRYWDTSKPTITIATREILPRYDVKYQLVPLVFEGYPHFEEDMKLLIWEWPEGGYNYGVGTDAALGLGQDNATIEVLREATPDREPGQVAEWASNQLTAFQMWPITLALGTLYSTVSRMTGERRQCRMAIESQTNGAAIQSELKKRGWTNFHPWQYNDKRRPLPDASVGRLGIMMNQWFRDQMMDMLLTYLSEESIDLPSPFLVQELVTLERAAGQKKAAAAADCHDDRVIGLGLPLFSLHINKPPEKQYARKRVDYLPGLHEDGIAHPIWKDSGQGTWTAPPVSQKVYRDHRGLRLQRIVNPRMPQGYR